MDTIDDGVQLNHIYHCDALTLLAAMDNSL